MINLTADELQDFVRQSSKGNQLKFKAKDTWYKADYTGYEGMSEYIVSHLLEKSSLQKKEFLLYEIEQISYKKSIYNATSSKNFLKDDWQIITLERLFKLKYGKSLYQSVWKIPNVADRFIFIVEQVKNMTGLKDFAVYLGKLLTIDAVFLNEDRHMHNIAVLMNGNGQFRLCPIFDNGACLLSDTTVDYPLGEDIYSLIDQAHAKTISRNFDEQLDAAEQIVGETIHFSFEYSDIENLTNLSDVYSEDIRNRVKNILAYQMRRYPYLFK